MQKYKIDELLNLPISYPEDEEYERTGSNENCGTPADYEFRIGNSGIFNKYSSRNEIIRNSMPKI